MKIIEMSYIVCIPLQEEASKDPCTSLHNSVKLININLTE